MKRKIGTMLGGLLCVATVITAAVLVRSVGTAPGTSGSATDRGEPLVDIAPHRTVVTATAAPNPAQTAPAIVASRTRRVATRPPPKLPPDIGAPLRPAQYTTPRTTNRPTVARDPFVDPPLHIDPRRKPDAR